MSETEKPCFIRWQFFGAELHYTLPLEITEYFTSLISLIFTARDAVVKGGAPCPQVAQSTSGRPSTGRVLFAEI